MGDMSEFHEDYALRAWDDAIDRQKLIDENAKDGFWENANGEQIPIATIDQRYAKNIIYWCEAKDIVAPQEIVKRAIIAQIKGEK
jgi:hypothetical protein